jgi:dephospho-CoA kinase
MGKSTAARFLQERGAQIVDTDELARQLVQPGQPALSEIQVVFGKNIVAPDGQLRRDELARIVFADAAARKKLEAILHPRIQERWLAQLETWRAAPKRSDGGRRENRALAVVVIPLLFETRAESHFDKIICVACSAPTQRNRLLERGWTPEQIEQRIAAQMPVEQKIARADFVIWTEGALDAHARQLDRILTAL